jgi:hypothetical protein
MKLGIGMGGDTWPPFSIDMGLDDDERVLESHFVPVGSKGANIKRKIIKRLEQRGKLQIFEDLYYIYL